MSVMLLLYIPLAVICYIFVAWTMHVEKEKMIRFMVTLALFMSVLLMSRVYRELWTPYILIFWPYEFGVMLYVCDSVTWPISIKRIGICLLLAAIAVGAGGLMQPDGYAIKPMVLHLMPVMMGVPLGLARNIVNRLFGDKEGEENG